MPRYQRKDSFHQRAKREGLRSRAAYKLEEIQRAHGLLRPGARVLDLGCWPGGWLQVASAAVGPAGRVLGVDRAAVEPPLRNANVIAWIGDLADPALPARALEALGGPADVLLSDAAPKLTGVRATDRAREEELLLAVERWIAPCLRPGGALLLKLLEGPEAAALARRIAARFERAASLRPAPTRKGSSERYLLARGLRADPGPGAER
jgi:23S rRNA (uridine2552-2'-O)-methyltransferase